MGIRLKSSFGSYLLIAQFSVLVFPYSVSKPATFAMLPLIVLLNNKAIFEARYLKQKILLIMLLVPGLLMTLYYDAISTIRFVPFLVLLMLFPYDKIQFDRKKMFVVSLTVFFFIVFTQFMLAYNVPGMAAFRDKYYPIENNVWNYGVISDQGSFAYREIRFGGIFYNPNVCASNVFMYLVASLYLADIIHDRRRRVMLESILIGFATVSMLFSGSRTFIVALVFFMLFAYVNVKDFILRNRITFRQLSYFIVVVSAAIYLVFLTFDSVMSGVVMHGGSLNEKSAILLAYVSKCLDGDLFLLVFGGMHRLQFDADLGYIIGGFGLLGFFSVLLFYRSCIKEVYGSFPFVIAILLASMGNSIIYNLAASLQFLVVLIIISQVNREILIKV